MGRLGVVEPSGELLVHRSRPETLCIHPDVVETLGGDGVEAGRRAGDRLAALHAKLTEEPAATLAMLRSMLTHPDAAEGVRENLHRQQRQLSASLQADDAILRTGLTGAVTLGVIIGRHLLRLDGLRDASPDEITALLRPTFENLVQPPAATDRAATEPE